MFNHIMYLQQEEIKVMTGQIGWEMNETHNYYQIVEERFEETLLAVSK